MPPSTRCAVASKPASAPATNANTSRCCACTKDFPERQVSAAVRDAVKRRLLGFDAVKPRLLARIEKRPVHLDLSRYPHLPQPVVAATRSADYATLLADRAGHG